MTTDEELKARNEQFDREWAEIERGMEFAKAGLAAYSESAQLHSLRDIISNCWYITYNNNDLWAWASADACSISVDYDLDKLILAELMYGQEGVIALMSIVKKYDQPQEPWFERGYLDKAKFIEARQWILDNMPPSDESGNKSIEDECRQKFYELYGRGEINHA